MIQKYKIVAGKRTLKDNLTLKEAEHWLCYFLNHGEDAYLTESP